MNDRWDRWFRIWFGLCALIALAMLGVVVWAVIEVVGHFTA